jgi:hypothetical protein
MGHHPPPVSGGMTGATRSLVDEDSEPISAPDEALMSMIKISADTLIRLRTECATSAGLIQQEIRTLEVRTKSTSQSLNRFFPQRSA